MKNFCEIFLLFILILIGFFLRFYHISNNPNSLSIDEVAFGYSAYSILKTGHDENSIFMPLTFRSTGDYKNPVLIYSLVPSIAVFGLNELAVRFTTALAGTLTIPAFFFLVLHLMKDKKLAFFSAAFLTVSAWHIYYSRLATESLIGLFFLIVGIFLFQKMKEGRKIWALLSSVALILSAYSYHSLRLFVPFFILSLLLLEKKKIKQANLKIFILTSFSLALPLAYLMFFSGANVRAGMVFLSNDIDYTRYVVLDHLAKGLKFSGFASLIFSPFTIFSHENLLLFFFWIKRYLNYFQPDFLFFNGLNMTVSGSLGLGVLYLFQLPLLLLGVIKIIKEKILNKEVIILWILLGVIPASLSNNEQNSLRSLIILPMLILIVSLGALNFLAIIKRFKSSLVRFSIYVVYCFLILVSLAQAFLIFTVHFPKQRGEAFMEGTKQTVLYALKNKDKYKEIVYDPYRGVEAPYIISIPYMYILFYSAYNPALYQKEVKRHGEDLFGFDKFTIRKIDWRFDRKKKDTLFIGSPWSLPQKDIREEEILDRVYLSNGDLALLIVSPVID